MHKKGFYSDNDHYIEDCNSNSSFDDDICDTHKNDKKSIRPRRIIKRGRDGRDGEDGKDGAWQETGVYGTGRPQERKPSRQSALQS